MLHRDQEHQKSENEVPKLGCQSRKGKQQGKQEEHSPLVFLRSRSGGGTDRLHGESRHGWSGVMGIRFGASEADEENLGMREINWWAGDSDRRGGLFGPYANGRCRAVLNHPTI